MDMIEKKFPEPGDERTLQGSNSNACPGREKHSAGDKKRDKTWREYQESLAAEAVQAAENKTKGGTPAPSPQRASRGQHAGQRTLGHFPEDAKKAKAKRRQLHLRKSGPSSDVESAHRLRMPADEASSSSSVAPDQRDVARACERACGVPCNGPRSRTLLWRAPSASPSRRLPIGAEAWPSTPRPWQPLRPESQLQPHRMQRLPGSAVRWRQPRRKRRLPRKPAWPRRPLPVRRLR